MQVSSKSGRHCSVQQCLREDEDDEDFPTTACRPASYQPYGRVALNLEADNTRAFSLLWQFEVSQERGFGIVLHEGQPAM